MSHVDDRALDRFIRDDVFRINFPGLLEDRAWSHTEEIMIRAAFSIWTGRDQCGVGEALSTSLQDEHVRTILEAMAMRRGMQIEFQRETEERS